MLLYRIVPEHKMSRFYEVHVQSTLLDSHAIVCTWGSIKNGAHRVRMIKTQTKEEAEKIAERIIFTQLQIVAHDHSRALLRG